MKKYLKLLLLFLLVVTIAGCNKDEEAKTFTISFDADNGVVYEQVVIDKQQTISLPTPVKKGFKFLGWYPSEQYVKGTQVTENTIVGKDITLYAKWEAIDVQITINLNGGTPLEEMEEVYVVKSTKTIKLPEVSKEGSIFLGWYVGETKCASEVSFYENTTVVAKFVDLSELESEYSINLNLNGGSFYDMNEPLSSDILNSDNYIWAEDDNLSDPVNKIHYEFSADYCDYKRYNKYYIMSVRFNIFDHTYESLVGNTAFLSESYYLAKWLWLFQYLEYAAEPQNKKYFEDIFNDNYTEDNSDYFTPSACIRAELAGFLGVEQYVYGDYLYYSHKYTEQEILNIAKLFNIDSYVPGQVTPLLAPIKEGYIFRGWYDNPDFEGNPIWRIDATRFGDLTLYAKWEEI